MDFQDQKTAPTEKVARNPNNANILKGGKVDPRSQLYQRSVAGREQLKDYLSRLSNSGADEADVFMAGVKSLMNRGHGYVGAYLDSKNPGRRYEKNQAMAITDKVMTDEGIGENPGARLTRPKVTDEEGKVDKEATKEARDKRKEANAGRGSGPQQAPGPSAKPVGQQRKEGKRESTGQPLEDSRRDPDIGKPETGPVSEWQNTLESRMKGEASTQDVLSAFQKQYQSKIKTTPRGGDKPAQPPASGGAQPPAAPGQPPTSEGQPPADDAAAQTGSSGTEVEEDSRVIPHKDIQDLFKDLVRDTKVKNKESISSIIEEIAQTVDDDYGVKVSNDEVINSIRKVEGYSRFLDQNQIGSGEKKEPAPAPEGGTPQSGQQESAGPAPAATPEAKAPQPAQQEATGPAPAAPKERKNSQPGQFKGKVASDISPSEIGPEEERLLRRYIIALDRLRSRGLTGQELEIYGDSLKWAASRGLPEYPGAERKILDARKKETAAAPTATPEANPGQQEAAAPTAPAPAPAARQPLPEEQLGRGGRPGGNKPSGFTPQIGKQATDAIRQAVSEGKTQQEVVNEFKQGNLFPGGLVTDTAQTNPLEGGSTPASPGPSGTAPTQEERGGSLLDEQGQAKDFRKSGPQPTGGGTARQLPLPLGRENTAAKLKGRADVENRRLAKQEKSLGKPSPRPRKAGKSPTQPDLFTKSGNPRKFNTSEMSSMSYDEFSQSVRSMMR